MAKYSMRDTYRYIRYRYSMSIFLLALNLIQDAVFRVVYYTCRSYIINEPNDKYYYYHYESVYYFLKFCSSSA